MKLNNVRKAVLGLFLTTISATVVAMDVPKEPTAPLSLRNLGNTCYMNAGLQLMLGLKGFNRRLISMEAQLEPGSIALDYLKLLAASPEVKSLEPRLCQTSLEKRGVHELETGDTAGCLTWLLDQLTDASIKPQYRAHATYPGTAQPISPLADLFYLESAVQQTYDGNPQGGPQIHWFPILNLKLDEKSRSLNELLGQLTNPPVKAFMRKTYFNTRPEYLFIHLARFESGKGRGKRNETPITFPLENLLIPGQNGSDLYDLIGFAVHSGGEGQGGHYYAYTKHDGVWHVCNDSYICTRDADATVKRISETGAEGASLPTVLVYEKRAPGKEAAVPRPFAAREQATPAAAHPKQPAPVIPTATKKESEPESAKAAAEKKYIEEQQAALEEFARAHAERKKEELRAQIAAASEEYARLLNEVQEQEDKASSAEAMALATEGSAAYAKNRAKAQAEQQKLESLQKQLEAAGKKAEALEKKG